MSCSTAMIAMDHVVTAKSDMRVSDIAHMLENKKLRAVPVLDEKNVLLGMFSTRVLLRNILPTSVTMEHGLQHLGFGHGGEGSLAKALVDVMDDPIIDHIDQEPVVLHSDTAMWEIVRLLVEHGSPLAVVERDTNKLVGLVSDQSILESLNKSVSEMADEGNSEA